MVGNGTAFADLVRYGPQDIYLSGQHLLQERKNKIRKSRNKNTENLNVNNLSDLQCDILTDTSEILELHPDQIKKQIQIINNNKKYP